MKSAFVSGAIALGVLLVSSAALADDPHDPAMRSAAARAHDKEVIRQLNLAELHRVKERDARLSKQWRIWREYQRQQGRDN